MTMPEASRLLVANDRVHQKMLDQLTQILEMKGHQVIRGQALDVLGTPSAQDIEVVVTTARGTVDEAVFRGFPQVHTVVVPTTGVEAIDLIAATRHGVAVANGATAENYVSMAEATLLFILALLYRLPLAITSGTNNSKPRDGFTLQGKTVGLIGYGKVAQALEVRLAPFGCKTLVHSRRSDLASDHSSFVPLDDLLIASDIVCLLGALTKSTKHTITERELSLLKPTSYLINTARGGLIDENSLCQALKAGRIAGAALDTFETEPLAADSPLRTMQEVILTPHCVGHTHELASSLLPAMVANIESALEGNIPPYCKNLGAANFWRRNSSKKIV